FSMCGITALYTSQFVEGFSNNEQQASMRALLRHNAHIDGTHYQMKTARGLHLSYIAFNPAVEQTDQRVLIQDDLLEATLQDVFDTITMQDHLNGGISLLICCAGNEAGPNISPEQVPIDLYITPHELQETGQHIGAAKNHQQRVSGLCSSICDIMNSKLQDLTSNNCAKMQWVHYFHNVIQCYQVVVEGWPNNIPFTNLSNISSAIPDLE
ncbi:uncharacterized protein EDB91DRAFT_1023468, partial [Suillus paluster]|uniref:uncharacterized protein n=1 Tax=Suillus paluster TaxID=48578 RepID=UPI001B8642E0